jgi:hypothetical protein
MRRFIKSTMFLKRGRPERHHVAEARDARRHRDLQRPQKMLARRPFPDEQLDGRALLRRRHVRKKPFHGDRLAAERGLVNFALPACAE